jgi:hypothetical protein
MERFAKVECAAEGYGSRTTSVLLLLTCRNEQPLSQGPFLG